MSENHFASRAREYAAFRPTYPDALYAFIAGLAERRALAWDCGTGNGQAAVALARDFSHVVATDTSAAQLELAPPHPRIEYRVAAAEASGLPPASADVITVAQALHWFDIDRFYAEARRVLAPGGTLVVWTYGEPGLDDAALNDALRVFNDVTVGPYWPAERELVRTGYRTVSFPFVRLPAPAFTFERTWTLGDFTGYLRSWSATARYVTAQGVDPVVAFASTIAERWGDPAASRTIRWPFSVLAGRVG